MADKLTKLAAMVPDGWPWDATYMRHGIEEAAHDRAVAAPNVRCFAAALRDAVRERDELQRRLDERDAAQSEAEFREGLAMVKHYQRNEERWRAAALFMEVVNDMLFAACKTDVRTALSRPHAKGALDRLRSLVGDDAQKEQT